MGHLHAGGVTKIDASSMIGSTGPPFEEVPIRRRLRADREPPCTASPVKSRLAHSSRWRHCDPLMMVSAICSGRSSKVNRTQAVDSSSR